VIAQRRENPADRRESGPPDTDRVPATAALGISFEMMADIDSVAEDVVPHQEINPSPDLQLQCVLARSGQKGLVFNLDIEGVETPEWVRWIDDLHK
jgi:hypothetical protein